VQAILLRPRLLSLHVLRRLFPVLKKKNFQIIRATLQDVETVKSKEYPQQKGVLLKLNHRARHTGRNWKDRYKHCYMRLRLLDGDSAFPHSRASQLEPAATGIASMLRTSFRPAHTRMSGNNAMLWWATVSLSGHA